MKRVVNGVTFISDGVTTLESGRRFSIFGIVIKDNEGDSYVDYNYLTIELIDEIFSSYSRAGDKIAISSPILYIKSPNSKLEWLLEGLQVVFSRKDRDKYNNHLAYDEIVLKALINASIVWKSYVFENKHLFQHDYINSINK